ncbi:MFS general substrate transporter [Cenococcum geophilum 1.58]|uniref:MFS general substrate transporter n=1 Tax=Cenococcum geophilum 1.58 TaxID=794803 RepID=UPI00358F99AA|nr:MFS general substrate transporter [Cenococcum geophilum 1.58]
MTALFTSKAALSLMSAPEGDTLFHLELFPGDVMACGIEITRSNEPPIDQKQTHLEHQNDRANLENSESSQTRIEELGRQRPERFRCVLEEVGFCYSVVMSQLLTEYFVSGFNVILPTVAKDLSIPPATRTWPANAFSLVVSAFLLPSGRMADMYGGYVVYIAGVVWLTVWSIIAGFSRNELMMDLCRALQGLGPAAYLPSGMMLLGTVYRPGPRKNLVFSIYGACAPLGFFVGIFFAGVAGQFLSWGAYFWIGAGLSFSTAVVAYFSIPSDYQERKNVRVKMDWLGTVLISSGLILVVFAITDSAHAPRGWATPYIYTLSIVGVLLLCIAIYVEGWVADAPLLPSDIFAVRYMKPLIIAMFFSFGSLGVFLLYSTYYMTDIMGGTPMQLVAWFTPMALGGCIISTVGGFVLHIVPGTVIIILAGVSWIVAPLLFAIAPVGANYWKYMFFSMICATIGIDASFNVVSIFVSATALGVAV